MQSIAETCVRFDAAHLSINLVSEIAVPMFTTLIKSDIRKVTHSMRSKKPHKLETKNFLTKITNDLVMATPIDSRKS